MPAKLFRFHKFEEVVTCLNVDFGCSSILGEWIERLWEGRVQEVLEIAGGRRPRPAGKMLLLQIRGNEPAATRPLTFWKITELCQKLQK